MKKFYYGIIAAFMAICGVVSCDEANNTTEGYIEGIFTLEQKYVIPEMSDTSYFINNTSDFDLNSGDRALMRIKYFIDNVVGAQRAVWEIDKIYGVIPTRELIKATEIDSTEYSSQIAGILNFIPYGAAWAWNGLQNINVVYYTDDSKAQFDMTVTDFANDTLSLFLHAKIADGKKERSELLSYDISKAHLMLPEAKQQEAKKAEKIRTKISMLYYDAQNDSTYVATIIGGECENPFK